MNLQEIFSGKQLYRFVSLRGFVPIAQTNTLYLMDGDITQADYDASEEYKDKYKYFLSLTRQSDFKSGYANSQNTRSIDKNRDSSKFSVKDKSPLDKMYVRITFNMNELMKRFEGKDNVNRWKYKEATTYSARQAQGNDEEEERLFSNISKITNVNTVISRVDIHVPEGNPKQSASIDSEMKVLATYNEYYSLLKDLLEPSNSVPASKIFLFGALQGNITEYKWDLLRKPSVSYRADIRESTISLLEKLVALILLFDEQSGKSDTIIDNYFSENLERLGISVSEFKSRVKHYISNPRELEDIVSGKKSAIDTYRMVLNSLRGKSKGLYDGFRNMAYDGNVLNSPDSAEMLQSIIKDRANRWKSLHKLHECSIVRIILEKGNIC